MEVLPQVIFAHKMEKIIRKGDIVWGIAFLMIKGKPMSTSKGEITSHDEIQEVLEKHMDVFEDMPKGLPPQRGFEHILELEPRSKQMMITPYKNPLIYKDEIERTI